MNMKLSWKAWAAAAAVLVAAAGGGAWWWQSRTPEVSYRTGKIERGPLQATVSASGAVNPVTQVIVGTQVSGQIKELYVDFNSDVKAGQLIAQIDPETFEYRVRQAQADVDSSAAAVLTAQANGASARASLSRARVDLVEAQRDLDRKKMLVDKQFITQNEADKAQALVNTTRESLKSAEAQLAVTEAQVKSAQANVAQRQAALAQARIDLQRTRILSPVNGIVIKRAVEKGQTVAASLQAPELFVIAQNLQDMQVDASIDESDVGRIRTGQRATFTVDAYPGQTFEGEIRQVRKAAVNVANVVTYVAVVGFSNAGGRLLPGMTANVRVVTEYRENVLKIPNSALRVRIAGVEPAGKPASSAGFSLFSPAYAQPAGGGGLAAMRERLVTELALTTEQQAKLDAISAEMRPQFMAMRELPEDQRGPAREKALAEMRGKISAMLTSQQREKYAALQSGAAQPPAEPRHSRGGGNPGLPKTQEALGPRLRGDDTSKTQEALGPRLRGDDTSKAPEALGPRLRGDAAAKASTAPSASPPPGGPQGPLGEIRNRLIADLQLTPPQVEKLDAIYAEARPRFMQLRDLPQEERQKARERLMADIRARITDILTPEQKPKYAALQAEAAGRTNTRGRIYLMDDAGKPKAVNVRLGITDGTMTELLVNPNSPEAAELKEGALVITGVVTPNAPAPQRPSGPRMPF